MTFGACAEDMTAFNNSSGVVLAASSPLFQTERSVDAHVGTGQFFEAFIHAVASSRLGYGIDARDRTKMKNGACDS